MQVNQAIALVGKLLLHLQWVVLSEQARHARRSRVFKDGDLGGVLWAECGRACPIIAAQIAGVKSRGQNQIRQKNWGQKN